MNGIYAGIPYIVTQKDGKTFIGLQGPQAMALATAGADMTILNDIGDEDPDEVMARFVETIPVPEEGEE